MRHHPPEQQMKMRALKKEGGAQQLCRQYHAVFFLAYFPPSCDIPLRDPLSACASWLYHHSNKVGSHRILYTRGTLFLENTSGPLGFFRTQKNKQRSPFKKIRFAMACAFSQTIKNRRRVKNSLCWTVTLVAHYIFVSTEKLQRPSTIKNIRKDYGLLYFLEIVKHEKLFLQQRKLFLRNC